MLLKTRQVFQFCSLLFIAVALSGCAKPAKNAMGYLHRDGKYIVDGNGDNFILRGLGPGGWMLQEGYMFHTKVGTQHEIRNMLEDLTDKETTDKFYEEWLQNFFTKEDVELTAEWGFNSIRLPIHYNLFTPAIEDEEIPGKITWNEKGFEMLDSMVAWCETYKIYLIIDLHAAPGGQGTNASISDYDTSKPSLWESEENQTKTVALWRKIANRYKDETYIGGYDLLNETNWPFENDGTHKNGCDCKTNKPLLTLFEKTIDAIREVDTNHIIFIEGNCWANNFNGLYALAQYDSNLSFSFHKYWNFNNQQAMQRFLDVRDSLHIPLYLGETGENSNTWFTDMVKQMEELNIGWSTWAYKQMDIDDPFTIHSPSWKAISDYDPRTGKNKPTEAKARVAMADMLENIKTKNCEFNPDVIHAYLSTPFISETKPYAEHTLPGVIYPTDYDIGALNQTWFDTDYQVVHSVKSEGNKGRAYRNDGIDITTCTDDQSNGYKVISTEKSEWMLYSLKKVVAGTYNITFRVSGKEGQLNVKLNDNLPSKKSVQIPYAKDEEIWRDVTLKNIYIGDDISTLRVIIEEGGFNINAIKFDLTSKS